MINLSNFKNAPISGNFVFSDLNFIPKESLRGLFFENGFLIILSKNN